MSYIPTAKATNLKDSSNKQKIEAVNEAAAEYVAVSTGAKPFLKWAGGKSQLIHELRKYYPFNRYPIKKYAEPFVGGGAVLFDILNSYDLQAVYISDINAELINTYTVIRDNVEDLCKLLQTWQNDFLPLKDEERRTYYNNKREEFNSRKMASNFNDRIEKAALFIFLNKTCFNGLYRVNRRGLFNVPPGAYKKPSICDRLNLEQVARKLQKVEIVCAPYQQAADFIDATTFVYIDPPYRPLTATANFTSYNENDFDDNRQLELVKFVDLLNERGAKIVVSNSDPKNVNPDDEFFDRAYANYKIRRVAASRMINCRGTARGKINELIISNF